MKMSIDDTLRNFRRIADKKLDIRVASSRPIPANKDANNTNESTNSNVDDGYESVLWKSENRTDTFHDLNYKYKRRAKTLDDDGCCWSSYSKNHNENCENQLLSVKTHQSVSSDDNLFFVALTLIYVVIVVGVDCIYAFLASILSEFHSRYLITITRHISTQCKKLFSTIFANDGKPRRRRRQSCSRSRIVVMAALPDEGTYNCSSGSQLYNRLFAILMTIIIAMGFVVRTEAGSCWQKREGNGKCSELFAKNMSKEECCRSSQEFSYVERNLSDVEFFFFAALGGGPECSLCTETCDKVKCGPEKRCVIRRGRPKCICAPLCKSSKDKNTKKVPIRVIDIGKDSGKSQLVNFHNLASNREVRSLSSEIASPSTSTLMLFQDSTDPSFADELQRQNNQRKFNLTKEQGQKLHHNHHHHKKNPNKRYRNNDDRSKNHHKGDVEHIPPLVSAGPIPSHQKKSKKSEKIIITADDVVKNKPRGQENSVRHRKQHHQKNLTISRWNAVVIENSSSRVNDHNRHGQQTPASAHHNRHQYKKHQQQHQEHARKHKFKDKNGASNRSHLNSSSTDAAILSGTIDLHGIKPAASARDRNLNRDENFPMAAVSTSENRRHNFYRPEQIASATTLDETIRNGFFNHGFPYPQTDLTEQQMVSERYSNPVCGTDGRTYKTECQLKKRACRQEITSLTLAYRGHCQTSCKMVNCSNNLSCVEDQYGMPHCINCWITCPYDDISPTIDPTRAVCGMDGRTYKSVCDINRMICKTGRSVAVAYSGPCQEEATCNNINCGPRRNCLIDHDTHRPICVACSFKCPRKRRPQAERYEQQQLCGNNKRTYYSWCQMKKDSCSTGIYIDVKHVGACNENTFKQITTKNN